MPHFLLIDDNDAFRKSLRRILEQLGHTVTEAGNGVDGCKVLEGGAVDVVITDVLMPEKDGLEVLREMRCRSPELRIIAMSGGSRYGGTDWLHVARQLGAKRTLAKPFSVEALVEALDEILASAVAPNRPGRPAAELCAAPAR